MWNFHTKCMKLGKSVHGEWNTCILLELTIYAQSYKSPHNHVVPGAPLIYFTNRERGGGVQGFFGV